MTVEEGGRTGMLRQKRTQRTGQLALGPRRAVCAERGPAWEAAEMEDREVGGWGVGRDCARSHKELPSDELRGVELSTCSSVSWVLEICEQKLGGQLSWKLGK